MTSKDTLAMLDAIPVINATVVTSVVAPSAPDIFDELSYSYSIDEDDLATAPGELCKM